VNAFVQSICGAASGASVIGAAHIARGKPNQDAVAWAQRRLWTYLAVADGHGGAPHYRSERGSRFAVETMIALLGDVTNDGRLRESQVLAGLIPGLGARLVARWREKVEADLARDPLSAPPDHESLTIYGTTCLGAAVGPGFSLMLQIGDGDLFACAASGDVEHPIQPDATIGEQTYSLCLPNAAEHVKVALYTAPNPLCAPDFIFASTDGFAKSFDREEAVLDVVRFYRAAVREKGLGKVTAELLPWLKECSEMGSGDDISVALFTAEVSAADSAETTRASLEPETPAPKKPEPKAPDERESGKARRRLLVTAALCAALGFLAGLSAKPFVIAMLSSRHADGAAPQMPVLAPKPIPEKDAPAPMNGPPPQRNPDAPRREAP
jgi:hypothetical protein